MKCDKAMTLVEVIIVAVIIGILCAIAIPNFNRARTNAYRDKCITNLQSIRTAKEHWSIETGADGTDTPAAAQLNPYFREAIWSGGAYTTGHDLICPLDSAGALATFGSSYNINTVAQDPTCKIDATHALP